ncbi:PilZ domain-containing protein [Microvirga sp. P5_D2]
MDQRSNTRQRTILEGRIVFNNRFSLIECAVRDLSGTGARIAFSHPIRIPQEFEIEIPNKKLSRWARVVWSNGKEYGITFADAPQARTLSEASPSPEGTQSQNRDLPEQTMPNTAKVQQILNEAQRQLAEIIGAPAENVRLKLEIDFLPAGTNKQSRDLE